MNTVAAGNWGRIDSREEFLQLWALAAVVFAFFGFYATGLTDIDVWWHIASGRYIAHTGSLPPADPFSMYAVPHGVRQETVLRAQWLGQYLFFTVFDGLGPWGLIVMKATILVACLGIVYHRARRAGAFHVPALTVLVLCGITLLSFAGERPQLLAFLLVSVIFLLLEGYSAGGRPWQLYLVPVLMLLWANCHGSTTLGALLLCLYGLGHIAQCRWGGQKRQNWDLRLLTIIGVAILCTILAPNGISNYAYLFQLQGSELQRRTSEYMTPLQVALRLRRIAPTYWMLVLLSAGSVFLFFRKRDMMALVMTAFLTGLSLLGWRYIPFFVLLAAPYLSESVRQLMSRIPEPKYTAHGVIIAASLSLLLYGVSRDMAFSRSIEKQRFPSAIVDFTASRGFSGRAFNSLEWGGYILWHLYPNVRPYIDGRVIDMNVFARYTHILWATEEGLRFLEEEKFELIMLPRANALTGDLYPLPQRLMKDKAWDLLYADKQGFLFKRNPTISIFDVLREQRFV